MRNAFPFLLVIPLVLAAGCADDDAGTTTFNTFVTTFSTMSSPTTVATVFDTWSLETTTGTPTEDLPASEGTVIGETGAETFGGSETSAPATDGAASTSAGGGTTTGTSGTEGDDSSGSEDSTSEGDPIPDPPAGCAVFAEWLGRHVLEMRYVRVDASACPRDTKIELEFSVDAPVASVFFAELPYRPCSAFGGVASPAGATPDGVVMDIEGHEGATSWSARLLTNGVVSDDVEVPEVLTGQHWFNEPNAPGTPIHRRADFSWIVQDGPAPGCDLLPVD